MQEPRNIILEIGLETLPEELRDELAAITGETVLTGVMRKVWDTLDLRQQDVLMSLLRENELDPENDEKFTAIADFLNTHVPDFAKYVHEEVNALMKAYHGALGE